MPLVLNVRGGARICVPDGFDQISTYVLLEQEDWFEEEIRFVRRWLQRGMQAVDVGANIGVYTVAMAQAVGGGGRVWAFEPTPAAAGYLQRSLELNGFRNVSILQSAISDREGLVEFSVGSHSELNAIGKPVSAGGKVVQVEATTLDLMAASHGWTDVDLVKLDVEGHELEAIRGGAGFFASASPLVMLEVSVGDRVDLSGLEPLLELGYDVYRLLPGPLLLVPFDRFDPTDGFLLNLFACKSDRASKLAAGGFLAAGGPGAGQSPGGAWAAYIGSAPYAGGFAARWPLKAGFLSGFGARTYMTGLAAYAHSRDKGLAPAQQIDCLAHAYRCVAEALEARATLSRRISHARLAWELGLRANAVNALRQAVESLGQEGGSAFEEPFLAPSPRYEALDSRESPADWLKCAVIEQYERLRDFSTYWGKNTPAVIEQILGLPYCSAEMRRRSQLLRIVAGELRAPESTPLLCRQSEENLNPEIWCGAGAASPREATGGSRAFPIVSIIAELPRLKIVDVGAMTLGEDSDPYSPLLRALRCEVVGFEPLEDECDKLNRSAGEGRSYLPFVIGDGSDQTFYECSAPMTSSLLEPNTALLGMFHGLEELVRVVSTRPVRTRRLDDIPQAKGADLLKVDVQGAELMVFQGAAALLREVLVIHTEVEFVPIYKDQPLFADIDAFLRSQGFVLHKLHGVSGRIFKSIPFVGNDHASINQFLWSDAVYVRDFMTFDRLPPAQLLKLAAILHENYGSHDLAAVALQAHDRNSGGDLHARYLRRLMTTAT